MDLSDVGNTSFANPAGQARAPNCRIIGETCVKAVSLGSGPMQRLPRQAWSPPHRVAYQAPWTTTITFGIVVEHLRGPVPT
jgi:hypothetical protein